ncbi:YdbH domain-containing protein [Neptuniibacter sp. QD37_11]|uniref:YdbH domain-containing protein n=1 Tax=Neptuniibacter sp. QD37_11 TaxID=3398209 RepID=UPI0039F4FB99
MRRGHKILWACLLLTFTFVIALPLAAYFFSPVIAHRSLQYWLEQNDFSAVELDMQTPSWNELHIANVKLEKHTPTQIISYQSSDITLQFNPYTLWQEQRLKLLSMPRSDIKITYTTEQSSESNNEVVDLSQALPSVWFNQIPIDAIRIGQVTLELDYPENQSDWQFIGALLFEDDKLYSRVKALRDEKDFGWSDLNLNKQNQFTFRLLEDEEPFFNIAGDLSFDDKLTLTSAQEIQLAGLQSWRQKLELHNLPIPKLEGMVELQGKIHFPLQTRFSPDELLKSIQIDQTGKAKITAFNPIPSLEKASTELEGALKFSLKEAEITLNADTNIQVPELKHPSLKEPIQNLKATLQKPLAIKANIGELLLDGALIPDVSPLHLDIEAGAIALEGIHVSPIGSKLSLDSIDLAKSNISGSIAIPQLNLSQGKTQFPQLKLSSKFTWDKDQLSNRYQVSSNTPIKLDLKGRANTTLSNGNTKLNWSVQPISLKAIDRSLEAYAPIPKELSVLKGTFFHKGSGNLKNGKFSAQFNNSIRAANLSWDETLIEGLNLDSTSRLSTSGRLRDTGSIKLDQVTTGVEIKNVQTSYQYQQRNSGDLLKLKGMQAELFEGLISLSDFEFNPSKPDITSQVKVDNIDLGAVMALERQQGLSGEGKLGGSFPLAYKDNAFTITDGVIKGLPPGGKILFEPTPAVQAYAAANVGLKMAIEALQNFHYEELDIGLNYLADGTALLETRLKGRNPDWQNGHPVDFTINVEENIPKLIKTLQFADKLTKTIEKRYR